MTELLEYDRLPLYDSSDRFLRWIDDHEGRALLKAQQAILLRTKKRPRAIKLKADAPRSVVTAKPKPAHLKRFHYSHTNETETNPPGVWEFSRLTHH